MIERPLDGSGGIGELTAIVQRAQGVGAEFADRNQWLNETRTGVEGDDAEPRPGGQLTDQVLDRGRNQPIGAVAAHAARVVQQQEYVIGVGARVDRGSGGTGWLTDEGRQQQEDNAGAKGGSAGLAEYTHELSPLGGIRIIDPDGSHYAFRVSPADRNVNGWLRRNVRAIAAAAEAFRGPAEDPVGFPPGTEWV
ncbi:MAG: hypothetical protein U5R48_02030 [Gammaproteobacteria bacterium]|nr:hypothetical protein [Gammaproteobacteria bacterium]